jgi:hypothetical protein
MAAGLGFDQRKIHNCKKEDLEQFLQLQSNISQAKMEEEDNFNAVKIYHQ